MNGSTPDIRPIPTPFIRRIAILREKFMPLCVWVIAICVLAVLAGRQKTYVTATGTAETRTVAVAPLIDGTIQSLNKDLFDDVQKGEVVALMDDSMVTAELRVVEAGLATQRATLHAEHRRLELEYADAHAGIEDDIRRFIIDAENARLDYLDRLVEQETNRVRVQRLAVQLVRYEKLLEDRLIDESIYDDTRIEYDALSKQIVENEAVLALAAELKDATATRLEQARTLAVSAPEYDTYLEPVRAAIAAQEASIAEVKERRMHLALRAPISGQVSQLMHRAGETVLSGAPLLMITDPVASRVVAYMAPNSAKLPEVGDDVEVFSRRAPKRKVLAKVLRVGRRVELMPEHLWTNTFSVQRGIPILLDTLDETNLEAGEAGSGTFLLPGEAVEVRVGLNGAGL